MPNSADGLEPITLAKPWLDHSIGDTVRVDPLRAAWLRENGYPVASASDQTREPASPSPPVHHPDFPSLRIEPEISIPPIVEELPDAGDGDTLVDEVADAIFTRDKRLYNPILED